MEFSKKVNSLILGLAALLAFGCAKENEPVPADSLNVLPKCQIAKRIVYNYDLASKPADSISYEYNNQRRLTRIHNHTNNSAVFEYLAGKVSKIKYLNHDTLTRFIAFDYNAAAQLVREDHFRVQPTGAVLEEWYAYTYNSANKIVRRTTHRQTPFSFDSIYYPAPNKVILKTYLGTAGNANLSEVTEFILDEKQRPSRFGGAEFHDLIFKNNILQETRINPVTNAVMNVLDYAYQYNPDGFPVKIQSTKGTGSLQPVESLDYSCQ